MQIGKGNKPLYFMDTGTLRRNYLQGNRTFNLFFHFLWICFRTMIHFKVFSLLREFLNIRHLYDLIP
jgi:hypothetical protein